MSWQVHLTKLCLLVYHSVLSGEIELVGCILASVFNFLHPSMSCNRKWTSQRKRLIGIIREAGNPLACLCELNPWESCSVIQSELGRLKLGNSVMNPSSRPRDDLGQPCREVEGGRVLLPLLWFCPDFQWVRWCLAHRGQSTDVHMPTSVKTLTDTSRSSVSSGGLRSLVLTQHQEGVWRPVGAAGICYSVCLHVLHPDFNPLPSLVCQL